MVRIFDMFCEEEGLSRPPSSDGRLAALFGRLRAEEGNTFANARTVRNFFGQCVMRHARRCGGDPAADVHALAEADLFGEGGRHD